MRSRRLSTTLLAFYLLARTGGLTCLPVSGWGGKQGKFHLVKLRGGPVIMCLSPIQDASGRIQRKPERPRQRDPPVRASMTS